MEKLCSSHRRRSGQLSEARRAKDGFTLIEMSIVLVIIALLIGGIVIGRTMIRAANIRAQISQISRYTAAVNGFRNKYGYLPGDIQAVIRCNCPAQLLSIDMIQMMDGCLAKLAH